MMPDTWQGWIAFVILWLVVASVTALVIGKAIKYADRREDNHAQRWEWDSDD